MSTTSVALNPVGAISRLAGLRKWALLPVVLAGTAMVILDFFIVNVAMPATQRDLHAGASAIQWVVAGYGLALAAGLVTGGRLGDHFGRRRMFALGLALFTLTSAACGVAPNAEILVAGRVAQGLASALLMPQVLAIIGIAYDGEERVKAITAYALTLGLAAVAGQLIGGALIQIDIAGLGWRSCFLVNVPVGIAALALTFRFVPESRAASSGRLDLVGAALVTVGLVAFALPLIDGRQYGWPTWTWLSLAASPVVLGAFVLFQRRLAARGGSPLVAPALFRERAFRVGLGMLVVFYAGVASFFLVLALYLQDGRGLSALDSGLVFSFEGIGFMATSMAGPAITRRLGVQGLALGAAVRAAALAGFWLLIGHVGGGGSVAWVALALLLDGAGMGMVMGPSMQLVLAKVSPEHAGAAAGVLAAAQQVGNAIGVALIGVVFFGALDHGVPHAFRYGLIGLAALSVVVVALVQRLPRS
jgi:EmrB/QacA subfamily drug resistance transporter